MPAKDRRESNKRHYNKRLIVDRSNEKKVADMTKRSQALVLEERIIAFIREHPGCDPMLASIHFQVEVEHSVEDLLTQSAKDKNDISKGKAADTSQLGEEAKLLGRNFAGEFTGMKWSESVRKQKFLKVQQAVLRTIQDAKMVLTNAEAEDLRCTIAAAVAAEGEEGFVVAARVKEKAANAAYSVDLIAFRQKYELEDPVMVTYHRVLEDIKKVKDSPAVNPVSDSQTGWA